MRFYHEQVVHQGRHITEGAVRAAGYWIIGGKHLVSSVIHRCVTCRKLRGRLQDQKMADLPADRPAPKPPFTNVGLGVFGPWAIMTRTVLTPAMLLTQKMSTVSAPSGNFQTADLQNECCVPTELFVICVKVIL